MADIDLDEIKRLHDKAYTHNQDTRLRAADDIIFFHITQWDDALLGDSQLAYKGEFNILRKAGRQILSDLRANPVQVDFQPVDGAQDDDAEVLDGLYLTDDRRNTSQEAYHVGQTEQVVAGFGAWELCNEYESDSVGNDNQVIRRKPIYEANNVLFWDPNAKLMDKSDAKYASLLVPYSEDGYKELVEDLTGEKPDKIDPNNFSSPEQSYVFPWVGGGNEVFYVTRFFHRTKVKDKILTMTDPLGQPLKLRESDLEEVMDELIDQGYSIESSKEIERWQVKCYIASGEQILDVEEKPGEYIPIVPCYGERAFVEGQEHYEGITRLAKDPQRLRNFVMSYLADIASRSPREKPIFFPEQVAGYQHMYEETGADNNYPYVFQNRTTPDGQELPIGQVSTLPAPQIPPSLNQLVDLTRQSVEDVANPGLPQDIADPDLSGKAVRELQNRLDQQSLVYQQNTKHAKRRDGEIYASMASVIYDTPRQVTLTGPDGQRQQVELMETVMDEESGELVTVRDLTNQRFEVYADIGMQYSSQKEQTLDRLTELAGQFKDADPNMHRAINLKMLGLMDGVNLQDLQEYANKQLVLGGFRQPETDEEKQMLEEASQQQEEPDAEQLLAQAEMLKGRAQLMKEQREAKKDQNDMLVDNAELEIDAYKAQTDRGKLQVDAQKAQAEVDLKRAQTRGTLVDSITKQLEPFRARVNDSTGGERRGQT